MKAFLKIEHCNHCGQSFPWEWVPGVLLNGKPMAGTGVLRSPLLDGMCAVCLSAKETRRQNERQRSKRRQDLVALLGGPKPYREFTFDKFQTAPGNRLAFERSKYFDPAIDCLYLWGPSGVGKTHLAWAIARMCLETGSSTAILPAAQISRKFRMKEPEEERLAVADFANARVLTLDDLGNGAESLFSRQILQEILDARDFNDRRGLVVTSKYSLGALASKFGSDTLPSRLAGLCHVTEMRGVDRRLRSNAGA